MENWKPCTVADGYEVSDGGNVRSVDRTIIVVRKDGRVVTRSMKGRMLRGGKTRAGYRTVVICGVTQFVHQLVLLAFVGPRPAHHDALHGDGDKSCNVLSNLSWGTRRDNLLDRKRHGHVERLTSDDVVGIKRMLAAGISGRAIARDFDVHFSTVSKIKTGVAHAEIVLTPTGETP